MKSPSKDLLKTLHVYQKMAPLPATTTDPLKSKIPNLTPTSKAEPDNAAITKKIQEALDSGLMLKSH